MAEKKHERRQYTVCWLFLLSAVAVARALGLYIIAAPSIKPELLNFPADFAGIRRRIYP